MRVLCLLLMALLVAACERPPETDADVIALNEALGGGDIEGYARATEPRPFRFPADHGPHPDFRTEWWYFTGNLVDVEGRRYGFQLTLFRNALSPTAPEGDSRWRTRQVYMAHFALTDATGGRFIARERFARAALGLAGAQAAPFRVWLEGWEVNGTTAANPFPLTLRAEEDSHAIALTLTAGKPLVLQGEAGLSRKSAEPGNASYYYSYTRLAAQGTITFAGETHRVTGTAWLDREWSTSALASNQSGWDWFALQLDNGYDLMLYRLRLEDGGSDPASAGSLVDPQGEKIPLESQDFRLEVTDRWESPRGGRYPIGWRIAVPGRELHLEVEPLLAAQELDLSVRYWEGAVRVRGEHHGRPVAGVGYVELTGYAESAENSR